MSPTFWEFVQAILQQNLMDEHWSPIFDSCSLCSVEYDFVLKFENLSLEQFYMTKALGIAKKLDLGSAEQRLSKTEEEKYLKLLSQDDLTRLNRIFEEDFRAFQYEHL